MSKIRVLHVYKTYFPDPPGGIQEFIRQLCVNTQSLDVENTVFTLSPKPEPKVFKESEALVFRCRSWFAPASCDLGGPDSVRTFRKLAEKADLIHYLFPWPYVDVLRLFAPKRPSVLTYISDIVRQRWLGRLYAPLMWHTLKNVDAIVYNAPAYADTSPVLSLPLLREKLKHIALGIDESNYLPKGKSELLQRFGLKKGEAFFLFVGVFRYYKGLHILIQAASLVDVPIVIAGTGPMHKELKKMVKDSNLTNVIFAGQVSNDEKIELFKACYAFVLPSHLRSEAYGMVLVEAAMFGKAMISCEIGTGTSFVNKHGKTGLVVPPESPEALAWAMNLLLRDEEMSQNFGSAARRRYEKYFTGAILGKEYKQLYNDILSRR